MLSGNALIKKLIKFVYPTYQTTIMKCTFNTILSEADMPVHTNIISVVTDVLLSF